MFVCHHCDNPPCVRPDHLFLGSAADNRHDQDRKWRHNHGAKVNTAKLTDEQVLEIRRKYGWIKPGRGSRPRGVPTNGRIAKEYGVSGNMIGLILTGRNWKHLITPSRQTAQNVERPSGSR